MHSPSTHTLPERSEMVAAYQAADTAFEGVFFTAVRTTGIFCRPTCPARKPKPENVEFFPTVRDALFSGYRPCRRCRPLEALGAPPDWLRPLLLQIEDEPSRRFPDAELRKLGLAPERVRRWFQANHGMTFQAYARARRLGAAFTEIRSGANITRSAFDSGYESLSGFNDAFKALLGDPPSKAQNNDIVSVTRIITPLGPMVAAATNDAVCLLEFADRRMLEKQIKRVRHYLETVLIPRTNSVLHSLEAELEQYFLGTLRSFSTPIYAPGSEFQRSVWDALQRIPSGSTATYGQLAESIGRKGAFRAVARANGDNRIALLIPCHRVIAKDGTLSGYGGGVWRKRRLLEIEGSNAQMH